MKLLMCAVVCLVSAGIATVATAENKAEENADPTGTWKWTVTRNNQPRETTLKLKLDAGALTGTITGRDNTESAIEEAKFDAGTVSFKVTRERDGQKFTIKYSGKLEGDAIKGKTEFERDGQTTSRDWEAKKST
jgi:DsbC/DsbD-like thiol-disulfide interchange protein